MNQHVRSPHRWHNLVHVLALAHVTDQTNTKTPCSLPSLVVGASALSSFLTDYHVATKDVHEHPRHDTYDIGNAYKHMDIHD